MKNSKDCTLKSVTVTSDQSCDGGRTPAIDIFGGARIRKDLCLGRNITVNGNASFGGDTNITGDALIDGDVVINGNLTVNGSGGGGGGEVCDPLEYIFYVAMNGDDTTGTGSVCKPFLTIQKGIDAAYAVASHVSPVTTRPEVYVMPGTYTDNVVLKANVAVRGMGINHTRAIGSWTIDSTFTTPPSNDARSSLFDMLMGNITADFAAVNSSEGKLSITGCRLSGNMIFTSAGSINQLVIFGGEIFGNYTQTGMNATLSGVLVQNTPTFTLNGSATGANVLTVSGGSFGTNVILNGSSFNITAILMGNTKPGTTITLNGTGATLSASVGSFPPSIVYSGGASSSQVSLLSAANGLAYIPADVTKWNNIAPTSVSDALDRIASLLVNIP